MGNAELKKKLKEMDVKDLKGLKKEDLISLIKDIKTKKVKRCDPPEDLCDPSDSDASSCQIDNKLCRSDDYETPYARKKKHTINKDGREYYIYSSQKYAKELQQRIDEGDVQSEELSSITKTLSKPEEVDEEVEEEVEEEVVSDDGLFTAVRESYLDFLNQHSRGELKSKVKEKLHIITLTRDMKDKIQDFGVQINELLQSDFRKMQKVDTREIDNMQSIIDRQQREIDQLKQQIKESPGIDIIRC